MVVLFLFFHVDYINTQSISVERLQLFRQKTSDVIMNANSISLCNCMCDLYEVYYIYHTLQYCDLFVIILVIQIIFKDNYIHVY